MLMHRSAKFIAAVSLAILLGAGAAIAKITLTPVSVTAWVIAPASGGEVNCVGGTPTGTWPPCTPGSKFQARERNYLLRQVSSDPLHTGMRTVILNATYDENGKGHIWGSWRLVLDNGEGEWEGTFNGFVDRWFGPLIGDVIGHGTKGNVEGMELRLVLSYETFPFGLETCTGYRFDPGAEN